MGRNIATDIKGIARIGRRLAIPWGAYAALSLLIVLVAAWVAGDFGARQAHQALRAQAESSAALNIAVLRSELEKQRSLPFVLAQDPDVLATLTHPSPDRLAALDAKFERLDAGTHAAVIYLLNAKGEAIAASNWRKAASPVGSDYRFRSYFQRAMSDGAAEYFALGTLTGRPGLFITRRLGNANQPLGVIVVKVQFDQVEAAWRHSNTDAYVTNPHGIVIIASDPRWHFMRNVPITPDEAKAIRASRQFGKAPLDPMPIHMAASANPDGDLMKLADRGLYIAAAATVPSTGWHMHVLIPAETALTAGVRDARSMVILGLMPLILLAGILLYRRQRALLREAEEVAARTELESRVEIRTAELRAINAQLSAEMDERQKAETRLQTARDELVQANRLAVLGQITAGVAHEVNQPVAAIRSYADNAAILLGRGDTDAVRQNLETIAGLTTRVGGITQELRAFSRKGTDEIGPTSLCEVIDGALMLLAGRCREQGVALTVTRPPTSLQALGKLIRLEQVLVNLLQNALEALAGQTQAEIRIAVHTTDDEVRLTVKDNGPGIPAEIADALFTPFTTSKPRGLGLGLVISNDIVAEFGGRLELTATRPGHTCFTVYLRRAM